MKVQALELKLRALRLADRQRAPVLGVNLGKLGFLAEVDVPELAGALSAIDGQEFTIEPRLAVDAVIGGQEVTAFNDVALVRFPGQPTAAVAVRAAGHPFVSPAVEALLVTPAAPHMWNRGTGWSCGHARGLPTWSGWAAPRSTSGPGASSG